MLTRIRNAQAVKKMALDVPFSKVKYAIAKILEREGYLLKVEQVTVEKHPTIRLTLRQETDAPFRVIRRVSKPGCRVYVKHQYLPVVSFGYGLAILSTPNGIMTNTEARARHLGGEILFEIY